MKSAEVKWIDFNQFIEIELPKEFCFNECLVYLNRSDIECLHKVENSEVYKLLKFESLHVLLKIGVYNEKLRVVFLNTIPSQDIRAQIAKYVWEMFDLETDLSLFYKKAEEDEILSLLINKYKGLRIIKINDIFEGLCWAIIGQQINLKFAYTLKKRLVEKYGDHLEYNGEDYFTFPTPYKISQLKVEDLRELQFTQRKAEYVIGVANLFANDTISKEKLECEESYESLHEKLVAIRGVGNWTADYTIMKCFNLNCAFPIADVGIHNALKSILGLSVKPSISEIEKLAQSWKGWEAYSTFYIWRWLYD